MKSILFEKKGHIGFLMLNRPEQRNALWVVELHFVQVIILTNFRGKTLIVIILVRFFQNVQI